MNIYVENWIDRSYVICTGVKGPLKMNIIFIKYYFTDIGVVPKYFYVPEFAVEEERKNPGSQERLPSCEEYLSLWDQSLYIIVKLLGLLNFVCF